MYYYEIALLKSPLAPLTYQSSEEIEIGTKVLVPLQRRKKLQEGVVLKKCVQPAFKCSDIVEISTKLYTSFMLELAKFISQYYICSFGEALSVFLPFDIEIEKVDFEQKYKSNIELSPQQEKSYKFLQENKIALLFAKTGSGKTEIYIKAIEEQLNKNKQAVLLMPEISLTAQMQKRLEKIFGSSVAIWHSKISKKRREEILQKLQEGSIKLIAGARSALFLPYSNLGIIVVDEEHDESYKSDQKPRVNVKDLAIYIGKKYDTQVILGSATASTSSFLKIPYTQLDKTYFQTKKSYTFINDSTALSSKVLEKIDNTLKNGHQTIVFVPTRANYKYQVCSSCGKSVECPFCSVSMSLHKNDLALKCHYCGYAQQIPNSCPSCKTGIIHNLRVGTAQLEEELQKIFLDKNIKRFDRDVIKTPSQLKKILDDFNDEKIDILIGTQMLSKGHDYHNVKLAVVLGIDSVLNMNSYKAREKALSLLIQISGRSGRKGEGEVLIQSKNEEFFSYYLEDSNYKEFLEDELEYRADLYPPYLRLSRIIFSSTNAKKAQEHLDSCVKLLKSFSDIEVVGFGQSHIFKIANKYRYEVLVRSSNIKQMLVALHSIKSEIAIIDMDTVY